VEEEEDDQQADGSELSELIKVHSQVERFLRAECARKMDSIQLTY
jgi:hypothetical protein